MRTWPAPPAPEGPRGADWVAVYRGRGAVPGCPEALADLVLERGLPVRWVGPGERLGLAAALRARPRLLVHPGGVELETEWRRVWRARRAVDTYVRAGGGYLGVCLGGYLAGRTPGYGLLPGDTDQWCAQPGVEVRHTGDAVVTVEWGGRPREVYVQDPPVFLVEEDRVRVLARYRDGGVAALAADHGRGRVVVAGPHPEAPAGWSRDAGLAPPRPATADLARQLVALALGEES